MATDGVPFHPDIGTKRRFLNEFAEQLMQREKCGGQMTSADQMLCLDAWQRQNRRRYQGDTGQKLFLSEHILFDLFESGWGLRMRDRGLYVTPPDFLDKNDVAGAKRLVRESLWAKREAQLRTESVTKFLSRMEGARQFRGEWHSITSLIRDGAELEERLSNLDLKSLDVVQRAKSVIDPYIQFVERGKRCKFTGLDLAEIWRYFRHTWLTPYKPLPGRTVAILIRDSASKNHPVIGIAALGSSIVQQEVRDRFIGWDSRSVIDRLAGMPEVRGRKWLSKQLTSLIDCIYKKDLIHAGIISKRDITDPTEESISALIELSHDARKKHYRVPSRDQHKFKSAQGPQDWRMQAETQLFRAKRCLELAQLLKVKATFRKYGLIDRRRKIEWTDLLSRAEVRSALQKLTKRIKSTRVGINLMDLTVCGAIPPYTHILGGKLVSMLMASPEVASYYRQKYSESVSVIASSMKGSAVVREPRLVFLGTTSLFGVGASQYNRLKIPVEAVGGKDPKYVQFRKLGVSEGYGSVQFSARTTKEIAEFLARSQSGLRVNSIFGEGVSPLLRKVREGLSLLGLPARELLQHRQRRIVYGVNLVDNLPEYLLGLNKSPKYRIPQTNPKLRSHQICEYWIERWLLQRITYKPCLEEMKKHRLVYPLKHGAIVARTGKQSLELPIFG